MNKLLENNFELKVDPEEELLELKKYAKENSVPIMQDAGIKFICDYIKTHKVHRILEIGSAIGYSAIQFAEVKNDVFVSTIEIDIIRYQQAVRNILECDLWDRITVYLANALNLDLDEKFDLIFIDGAKAQYINFFEKFKNNLSPDGVIISDNLSFHGMVEDFSLTHNKSTIRLVKKIRKYIEFLENNPEFDTEFFDIGDRISVSKRKQN